MLFLPYIFLQSVYHLIYAHCDISFMTYGNSHMFRHRGAILRKYYVILTVNFLTIIIRGVVEK